MNTVITKVVDPDTNKTLGFTMDEELGDKVVESLVRNNAFCPNVDRVIFATNTKDEAHPVLATVVYFKDGTKSTVKNCGGDKITLVDEKVTLSNGDEVVVKTASQESKEAGVTYAILKRLLCEYDENGKVSGSGFVNFLKRVVKNAYCQDIEEAKTVGERKIAKARAKAAKPAVNGKRESLRSVVKDLSTTVFGLKNLVEKLLPSEDKAVVPDSEPDCEVVR